MKSEIDVKEMVQIIPELYEVGDIVYTRSGERVQIQDIGYKGYDCHFKYLTGKRKGKTGYIAEVNWLYVWKEIAKRKWENYNGI